MKLVSTHIVLVLALATPAVMQTGDDKPVQPTTAQRSVFLPACHACHCAPCVVVRAFHFDDLCNAISSLPDLSNKAIERLQDCCRRAKKSE